MCPEQAADDVFEMIKVAADERRGTVGQQEALRRQKQPRMWEEVKGHEERH